MPMHKSGRDWPCRRCLKSRATEAGRRRPAAQQQGATDRAMGDLQIPAVPPQRQLHENAVIHAVPRISGNAMRLSKFHDQPLVS